MNLDIAFFDMIMMIVKRKKLIEKITRQLQLVVKTLSESKTISLHTGHSILNSAAPYTSFDLVSRNFKYSGSNSSLKKRYHSLVI